jgi:ribosome biogenesis GTPase / thiamine phosphate phosphatase
MNTATGTILTYHSDFYRVRLAEGGLLECKRKALLKKQGVHLAVGDNVEVEPPGAESELGWIVAVNPPFSRLVKPKIHNVTHVLVVMPWQSPEFSPRQLDRLLAKVALSALPCSLVISKVDIAPDTLVEGHALDYWLGFYGAIPGLQVFPTRLDAPESLQPVKEVFTSAAGTWVLAGVSGAGKSSLLNALDSTLNLRVGDVSHKIGRGTHTTRHTELHEALGGILIADAPGFSQLSFEDEDPYTLAQSFHEYHSLLQQSPCEYNDCLHQQEPACQIRHAVEAGTLSQHRYESYLEVVREAKAGFDATLEQQQKHEAVRKHSKHSKGGKAIEVVRLNPELRDSNRRGRKQELKQLQQYIHQQQRVLDGADYDDETLDDT